MPSNNHLRGNLFGAQINTDNLENSDGVWSIRLADP